MSIYDKSSLVLIPSGTKTGKIFSQKPVSGDGDFTFTRSSAATRVNADGNIEKETQNLLLQSNNFDTTWQIGGAGTITENQAGYDGTNNASLLTKTAAWTNANQNINQSGVQTFSVYAKANASDWALLVADHPSTDPLAYFDLTNGVVGITTNMLDPNIVDVGNGWYRISITYDMSISQVRIYPAEANTASGTSGSIYIQDAQLEQGLVARDYIETTTAAVYGGITDNTPRLDYTDSSCPALLLEPQRTNRVTNSEYLNGDWSENRSTLIVNDDTSPEGVNNATKLQEDTTASNTHFTGKGYNYVSGTTYSWSVYAKADGRDEIAIQQGNPNVISFNARFNFTSETAFNFGNGTARIEDAGNGWYRCIIEGTTALLSSGTNINVFLRSGDSTTYTGDGTSGVLFYGFQLEEGSYATSYIPTYGSSVSRVVDSCNQFSASDLIGQEQGTMFLDFVYGEASSTNIIWQIRKTTGVSRQVDFRIQGGDLVCLANSSGTTQFYFASGTAVAGTRYKIAVRYSLNDSAFYVNGSLIGTETSCDFSEGLFEQITFNEAGGSLIEKNSINQAVLFPTALSDAELAALTTI